MNSVQFKSEENTPDGNPPSNNIVLCTEDKTYNIRQVSTSNTVFVCQPSPPQPDQISNIGLEAIAKCTSVLEVLPETSVSAVSHFKAVLPTYTSTGHYESSRSISKRELFSHTPVSDGQCQKAWLQLCCFELDDVAVLPSESIKLKVWQAILTNATAQGIDLAGSMDTHQREAVINIDSEWPMELNSSFLDSVTASAHSTDGLELDPIRLANMVGIALLRESTNDVRSAIPSAEFQTMWADLMPEKWRPKAEISLLDGQIRRENNGVDIAYSADASSTRNDASAAAQAEAKSTLGAKRKWHEKFRASKKTA